MVTAEEASGYAEVSHNTSKESYHSCYTCVARSAVRTETLYCQLLDKLKNSHLSLCLLPSISAQSG